MAMLGWQQALWWTSLPALLLIGLWAWYGRNRPAEHPSITPAELAVVAEVAAEPVADHIDLAQLWRTLLDRNVLLLAVSYLFMNYVFYMLSNWFFPDDTAAAFLGTRERLDGDGLRRWLLRSVPARAALSPQD